MVNPPTEHLTEEGVYIPPSLRGYIRINNDPDISHVRQLHILYSRHHVRRWKLPSWGWIGVRTHYGHSAADWETFRRKVVGAYSVTSIDEPDKFRVLWLEDESRLDGADGTQAREYGFPVHVSVDKSKFADIRIQEHSSSGSWNTAILLMATILSSQQSKRSGPGMRHLCVFWQTKNPSILSFPADQIRLISTLRLRYLSVNSMLSTCENGHQSLMVDTLAHSRSPLISYLV